MLRVKSLINTARSSLRRSLHIELLKENQRGVTVRVLRNDRNITEAPEAYIKRSTQELKAPFKPHRLYIYVDKAVLKEAALTAGHIVSFLTNQNASVIEDSAVNLRNGQAIETKRLVYTLDHEKPKQKRTQAIYKVALDSIQDEFVHLFKKANPLVPVAVDTKKFLIEFPIGLVREPINVILERVQNFKNNIKDREYILCDGIVESVVSNEVVSREIVERLNCVSGFYEGLGVKGTEANPSPQMAGWSYTNFLLGTEETERLFAGTGFKNKDIERTQYDKLSKK